MKRKTFLLICAVLIAALLIGVLAACDPGSKEQGGSQTPGGTTTPGEPGITTPVNPGQDYEEQQPEQGDEGQEPGQDDEEQNPGQGDEGQGEGDGTQTPGDNDQDDEQGGEVTEPAKLIFEKTDAGYSVTGYEGTPTVVVIPETYEGLPVTSIGSDAFWYCDSLTSVAIPDSVTSIGGMAFVGCTSLERLTVAPGNPVYHSAGNCIIETETGTLIQGCNDSVIPSDVSVTSIGYAAFYNCNSLTSIVIPDSVTSIGYAAFYNCTSLTFVALGNGVTSIGSDAFWGCYKLIEVYNKSSLDVTAGSSDHGDVGYYAKHVYTEEGGSWLSDTEDGFRFFYDGETGYLVAYYGDETKLTLPDSFTAYDGTEVTSYQIYDLAFLNTHGMMHELIGSNASMSHPSSLTSVTIGNSVTSIGGAAFAYCDSLTSVTIGNSVTSIGSDAFWGCYKLVEVYNKSSLDIAVGSENNGYVGYYAKHVYTEEGGSWLSDTEDGFCFLYDGETGYLVAYLGSETELTLPESFTAYDGTVVSEYQINDYAFEGCTSLTSVTISDSVESIGNNAFSDCTSLTSVTIGDSVTSIGRSAFYGCDSLTSVTIGNSVTSIGDSAFAWCTSLTSLTIPDSVTSIGDYAFAYCDSLTSVTIGNSVTSIEDSAFEYCTSLTSIVIPDSVTSIGSDAFEGCDNLQYNEYGNALYLGNDENPYVALIKAKYRSITSVDINASTKVIYGSAFYLCTSLTSVTIPDSVTSIAYGAFAGCVSLETLTVDKRNPVYHSVGNCVIETATGALVQGCNNSVIPTDGSVTSIGDSAFAWCISPTSIVIPDSVTSIGDHAFGLCQFLTSITIPDSVTSIGSDAFSYCDSLTSVTFEGTVEQWKAITKGGWWNKDCPFTEVKCSDGNVSV